MGPNDVARHLLVSVAAHARQYFDGGNRVPLRRSCDFAVPMFARSSIAWKICVQAMTGLRTI
jgi:hypothetical protein